MLTKKQLNFFNNNGYVKFKMKKIKLLKNLRSQLIKQILSSVKNHVPQIIKNKKISDEFILNEGMIQLEKKNHELLVEIYNSISRSTAFYSLMTNEEFTKKINQLLKKKSDNNLFINSNTVRMDIPGKNKFMYGWHQDSKSNIKGSKFIQLWMPVVGNIDKKIGGLEILKDSFKYDIKTTHTKDEQKRREKNAPIRASLNTRLLEYKKKFKKHYITCKFGEVVLFDSMLMHKSGLNLSKNKMRYVIACFFHNIINPKWNFKIMDQKKANLKY